MRGSGVVKPVFATLALAGALFAGTGAQALAGTASPPVPVPTEISLPGARFEPAQDRMRSLVAGKPGDDYHIVQLAGDAIDQGLADVRKAGVEVIQYVPHRAFLVYGTAAEMLAVSTLSNVRWVGRYLPADRLPIPLQAQVANARGEAPLSAEITPLVVTAAGSSVFDIAVFARANLDLVAQQIAAFPGASLRGISRLPNNYFNLVRAELPLALVEVTAQIADVVRIDAYFPPQLEDERAAQIVAGNYTSVTTLNPPGYNPAVQFGVNGTAVTVAVVDDGVSIPGNGGFYITAANTVNGPLRGAAAGADGGHGHLNASIVAGSTPFSTLDPTGYNYGLGVAPAANIVNIPFLKAGYTGSDADAANDSVATAGPNGVLGSISNNSWGAGTNGNAYDSLAAMYDGFARDASSAGTIDPLMLVFSAGNSGPGALSLTRPKMAKNIVAVGNSENIRTEILGTDADNIDDLRSNSSRGPAADGRIKPELTAPGTAITGGRAGSGFSVSGHIDANHSYSIGTSHSAPQIAGAAALFTQFWKNGHGGANPSPALLKAALLNSAVEMNGLTTNTATIPNGIEGWGRAELKHVFDGAASILYVNQTTELSTTGAIATRSAAVASVAKPVRVSLVWTDPPAVADPALVNNLDLTVTVGGTPYLGNVFSGGSSTTGGVADVRNNVEQVFLPAGIAAGTPISVQVFATGLFGDGILGNGDSTDQHFALIIYNATATAGVAKSADAATVPAGSQIGFTVTLDNFSGDAATGVGFSDNLPAGNGIKWSIDAGNTDPSWSISGTPPNESLVYSLSTVPDSSTSKAHVVSSTSTASCGPYENTATFTSSDAGSNQATASATVVGPTGTSFSQNFDGVTAPALPGGWTATNASGPAQLWVTSDSGTPTPVADTAPNAAYIDDPDSTSDKRLESPVIAIESSTARLTFRQNYSFESGFDGGALEISIGGGPFADILDAGGSFAAGGYNGTIVSPNAGPAWTGSSGGFVTTTVNLPASAAGQNVQLRWRMTSDSSVSGPGWRVDTVAITETLDCAPTAVTVAWVTARTVAKGVLVRWRTTSAARFVGFDVFRQTSSGREKLNRHLLVARPSAHTYSYLDRLKRGQGRDTYWIRAVGLDGSRSWIGPVKRGAER